MRKRYNPRLHYRVKEAASVLNVASRTINLWLHKGKVASAFKTGKGSGQWAIPKIYLDQLAKTYHAKYTLHYMGERLPYQDLILWFMFKTKFKYTATKILIERYSLRMLSFKDFEDYKIFIIATIKLDNPEFASIVSQGYGTEMRINSESMRNTCDMFGIGDIYDDEDVIPWKMFSVPFARWDLDCMCARAISNERIRDMIFQKYDIDLAVDEIEYWRKYVFNWTIMTEDQKREYLCELEYSESQYKLDMIYSAPESFQVKIGLKEEADQKGYTKYIIDTVIDEFSSYVRSNKGNVDPSKLRSFAATVYGGQDQLGKFNSKEDPLQNLIDSYKDIDPDHEVEARIDAIPIDKFEGKIMAKKVTVDEEVSDVSAG